MQPLTALAPPTPITASRNTCKQQTLEDEMNLLWNAEFLGVTTQSDDEISETESELLDFFKNSIKRQSDGRYIVSLPFKENLPIQAVVNKNASEFKVRVVKDAGARRREESVLNDVLHQGKNLLPEMFKVLT